MDDIHFSMVSEWMGNGNIIEYLKVHQDVNRFHLVRLRSNLEPSDNFYVLWGSQLTDVTKGLIYMHGREMVHGDLKGVGAIFSRR